MSIVDNMERRKKNEVDDDDVDDDDQPTGGDRLKWKILLTHKEGKSCN